MKKLLFVFTLTILTIGMAWAQTAFTATYSFTGSTGNVSSLAYNGTTYDGITMGTIDKVGVTNSSKNDCFRATGWPTGATNGSNSFTGSVNTSKYIGFTISAASGYKFTVSSIQFGIGRSGTGTRQCQWRGSYDSYGSILSNYTTLNTDLSNSSGVLTNPDLNSSWTGNILTLGSDYANITTDCGFRLYMYNAEATGGTAGLQGSITITGTFESAALTPTITVNPATLSGFGYVVGSGPSSEKTFTVQGSILTANISINVQTSPAQHYEISTTSGGPYGSSLTLTQSGGSVSETTIYVRLKAGLSAGDYNSETITVSSSGATSKTVTCSGTVSAPVPNAPTATAATSVSYNKFTANWNSVSVATKYYLDVYTKGAGATDLIISEYVEGSGNNKYLEIYNGTNNAVDLSDYKLQLYANGNTTTSQDITLSGTLNSGQCIVYKNSSAALTLPDGVTATNNAAVNFNGNDAVALYKISTSSYVDIFGRIGEDPGTAWTSGSYTTLDKTLVRKSSVTSGITTNPSSGFPTLATEWDMYDQNDVSHLGSHTMASGNSYVSGYENKDVGNVTSYEVSGLEADNTYYYVVRAYNDYGTSANSNEISVTTTNDATLPVELSAFTANINSQGGITLMWVTQSETGVNGFYVNRAMVNDLAIAERISSLIPASNTSQQQVYVYNDNELYEPGTYYYWLEIQDIDGVVSYYGSRSVTFGGNGNNGTPEIPLVTGIRSIYPNPFNPSATIMYELDQPANVNIEIYNNRGQIVRSFNLGQQEKNRYKLLWDGTDNSGSACGTGIYFVKMQAGKETFVKKAALVK